MATLPNLNEVHSSTLLTDSAIAPDVVQTRGYRTVTAKVELKSLGFGSSQLLVPTLLLPIWGVGGEIAGYQSRPDSPRVKDGKPVKYETPAGMRMVLDIHPSMRPLLTNPAVPLFVTEGIKKGDALASCGLCAVALLGVWNWRGTNLDGGKTALADWESVALNGRQVFIVFDSDVMLKPSVHGALARLKAFAESRGASVALIYLPLGQNGAKQGVDDYLAAGGTPESLLSLAQSELLELAEPSDSDHERGSIAAELVDLALTCELFHDDKRTAYAVIEVRGHRETWPARSSDFKRWLAGTYYMMSGKPAKSASIADALNVVEAKAQFEGEQRKVWTRTAEGSDACVYLDLGDESWRAVRLAPDGWTMVDDPPVHFVRGPASAALPEPQREGSLEDVRPLLNLGSDADYYRAVAWLLGVLRPRGPYPVLAFIAEQGSGKSLSARFLRSIVDPSAIPLRGMPRDERDLVIAARANHVICLDNVSHLSQWLSDALCRMASGGGWSTRRLYTDAEEEIFEQSRPVLITGIDDYITSGDLLERSMLVNLPTISPQQRRQEVELEREYRRLQPLVLGALLDATCAALANVEKVQLDASPRMADFATWVVAAETALGWPAGAFLDAYMAGAFEAQDVVLEASILGEPLRQFVEDVGSWQGTAAELLAVLNTRVSEETRRSKSWATNPRGMTSPMRRLAPTLRALGIAVESGREKTRRRRRLIFLQLLGEEETVQTVQPSTDFAPVPSSDGSDASDGSEPDMQQPGFVHVNEEWEMEVRA